MSYSWRVTLFLRFNRFFSEHQVRHQSPEQENMGNDDNDNEGRNDYISDKGFSKIAVHKNNQSQAAEHLKR